VTDVLPRVATVALSSQDVYAAYSGLREGREVSPVPITEDSPLRAERYPYRGAGLDGVPDDYEKIDVEQRWRAAGAIVLRLPLIYGPHDWQRREEPVLRRARAGRRRIPIGAGNLLWTRGFVDDLAAGVLAALDSRAADGQVLNLGETTTRTVRGWFTEILRAPGPCSTGTRAIRRPASWNRCGGISRILPPGRPGPTTTRPWTTRPSTRRPAMPPSRVDRSVCDAGSTSLRSNSSDGIDAYKPTIAWAASRIWSASRCDGGVVVLAGQHPPVVGGAGSEVVVGSLGDHGAVVE
jgi:hypothetical protein